MFSSLFYFSFFLLFLQIILASTSLSTFHTGLLEAESSCKPLGYLTSRSSAGSQYVECLLIKYRPWVPLQMTGSQPSKGSMLSGSYVKKGCVKTMGIKGFEDNPGGFTLPSRRLIYLGLDQREGILWRFGTALIKDEFLDKTKPAILKLFCSIL